LLRTKLKKRHAGALVAGLTLSIVILAALHPGWAEAQEEVDAYAVSRLEAAAHNANDEQTNAAGATTPASQAAYYEPAAALRVVEPGDSLWSIAQERLGPNATPQQVANEVERIYGLNQNQIGNNPDLILPNQELLLPSVGKPAASEPTASVEPGGSLWSIAHEQLGPNATPQQVADEVARIHWLNRDRIGEDPNLILPGQQLSLPPVSEGVIAEPAAPEPTPETAAVPEQPADEPAAKKPAEAPAEPSYPDPDYANLLRSPSVLTVLLSLGFFLFALAVAAFGAWKLFRRQRLLRERYEPSVRHDWSGHYTKGHYTNYDRPRRQEQEEASEPEVAEPAAHEGAPEPTPEKPIASRADDVSRRGPRVRRLTRGRSPRGEGYTRSAKGGPR
jgi:hypothetical protein